MKAPRRPGALAIASCMVAAAALSLLLGGCDDDSPPDDSDTTLTDTADADTGLDADPGDVDVGPDDTDASDTRVDDVPDTTADTSLDGDDGTDLDVADSGDTTVDPGRTLADYRTCVTDNDCPVGLGLCVTELPLNRTDPSGADRVPISTVFPELGANEGLCTRTCTDSDAECQGLVVNDRGPDLEPWTCQLVYVGSELYAQGETLPFDDQLDPTEQAQGRAFAAICRPPVQLDEAVDRGFCAACVGSPEQQPAACAGDSTCWNPMLDQPAGEGEDGFCLAPCGTEGCPTGFSCQTRTVDGVDLGELCWPVLDTCTACRDLDGDGRGDGRCGSVLEPVTAHDCDDRNPDAWFDLDDPTHAFPQFCGEHDYNCNGLGDADEQIGAAVYGAEHCTACGVTCSDTVAAGQRTCKTDPDTGAPYCGVVCDDPNLWADCDGDFDNGCETPVDDPARLYYPDRDGDGYGDAAAQPEFACDAASAPTGTGFDYVQDHTDCNDDPGTGGVDDNPGAAEVCDGRDNDCDVAIDEDIAEVGSACTVPTHLGQCRQGVTRCDSAGGLLCDTPQPGDLAEICDVQDLDEDCDGAADDDDPEAQAMALPGASVWYLDGDGDGYGDNAAPGIPACDAPTPPAGSPAGAQYVRVIGDCDDGDGGIHPLAEEACDTVDDNCNGTTEDVPAVQVKDAWYPDTDGDGYPDLAYRYSPRYACDPATLPSLPSGSYVTRDGPGSDPTLWDCDDSTNTVSPADTEICQPQGQPPIDEDCDGFADESDASNADIFYIDNDGDGFSDGSHQLTRCTNPDPGLYTTTAPSAALNTVDCDDFNGLAWPDSTHPRQCDGVDYDCNGTPDSGCPQSVASASGATLTAWAGTSPGGTSAAVAACPTGQYLIGLEVNYLEPALGCNDEAGVYGLTGICASNEVYENRSDTPYTYIMVGRTGATTPAQGSWSSSSCQSRERNVAITCPGSPLGQALTGIRTYRSNDTGTYYFETISERCTSFSLDSMTVPATLEVGSSTWLGHLPASNVDTNDTLYTRTCASGEVAVGFNAVIQSSRLRGLALRCATLELTNKP